MGFIIDIFINCFGVFMVVCYLVLIVAILIDFGIEYTRWP